MEDSSIKMTLREICKTAVVHATPREVWDAWTTSEGARTFFAPQANIVMSPGGPYELYFNLDQPEGLRGSEGCVVRELEALRFFSVTWNFPPSIPALRNTYTMVGVHLQGLVDGTTRVVVTHSGWGAGPDWDAGLRYFQRAWKLVLARLERRFTHGPMDWSAPFVPDDLR